MGGDERDLSPTRPPRIVGEAELGRGGMAVIHRVHDTLIGRTAAMKVLELDESHPEVRARFVREAQIIGQLDHPHIVPLYELGEDAAHRACFTMKLVEGQTLTQFLKENKVLASPSDLDSVIRALLKVCDAIAFAHSRGVVHRDLKPDNIMIGGYGQVYVMDWGIAHLLPDARVRCTVSEAIDRSAGIIGSPAYMSPEQATGNLAAVDAQTDVFGMGAIVYEVLTGRPPYEGSLMQMVHEAMEGEITPPDKLPGIGPLPRGLCNIAMRAMAKDRGKRYASIESLAYDLERFQRGGLYSTQKFAAGTLILKQNETGDTAYIIQQGHCEAFKIEAGRKVTLRKMGPGEVFGETAVLTEGPRSASVVALDDVTCMTVSRESLTEGLSLDSRMGSFVRTLAERFRDLDAQASKLRKEHLRLLVRERLLTAVIEGRGRTRWSALAQQLVKDTSLSELDLLAIVGGCDDLVLDENADLLRFTRI
jgi:serine/threonine-protein kinase